MIEEKEMASCSRIGASQCTKDLIVLVKKNVLHIRLQPL